MKWIFFALIFVSVNLKAQKPALDQDAYGDWQYSITNPYINPDGSVILYTVENTNRKDDLVIKHTDNATSVTFKAITSPVCRDEKSQTVAFKTGGDTLHIVNLNNLNLSTRIGDVGNFIMNSYPYIGYSTASAKGIFTLYNRKTNTSKTFIKVDDFHFSADGHFLFLKQRSEDDTALHHLLCLQLKSMNINRIVSNQKITSLIVDSSSNQITFVTGKAADADQIIWYYQPSMKTPVHVYNARAPYYSAIAPFFNRDGSNLLFSLTDTVSSAGIKNTVGVSIWSYTDSLFQREIRPVPATRLYSYDTRQSKLVLVADAAEELVSDCNGPFALVRNRFKSNRFWEEDKEAAAYVVNLKTGEKVRLPDLFCRYESDLFFSPTYKYVINYLPATRTYYAYTISSGQSLSINNLTPHTLYDDIIDRIIPKPFGVAGWADEDQILIYTAYDIIQLDLSKRKPPRNLTNGFGRRNGYILSFAEEDRSAVIINPHTPALLNAFSRKNKTNGFGYLSKKGDPVLHRQDACTYQIGRVFSYGFEFPKGMKPIRAKHSDIYLVRRESATEHPNLYTTHDFRTFTKQTFFAPEKKYNWLTATLLSWRMTDGKTSQGILYKPENFDSSRKYPVIFHYYQRKSDKLHEYLVPQVSTAAIDIPTYVSNGYIVFVPDIYYTFGRSNGAAALNTVGSAATYLKNFHFVDSARMGLQAHSHGASQTNYIITHSDIFAAACASAGTSNLISSYGQLTGYGASRQPGGETGFMGIGFGLGKTPWTAPELYMGGSPVFYIHQVTTPLLLMHGNKDTGVPFEQSIEMFTALRRAGKQAWLLEYQDAGHFLSGMQAADFTSRMREFFDYFLKDGVRPGWMK